jgi:integrase
MLKHEIIMRDHPEIGAWLKDRPFNTQRQFAEKLMSFSQAIGMAPEEWRRLDKFKARDLAWSYVEPLKNNGEIARAMLSVNALKSWYRNLNGEILPLDSGRGGKHVIRKAHKKAALEHIPDKAEVYRIVDMAGNLRDQAILLTLFQSGIRVNALLNLTYGMVKEQLDQDIIVLKISGDVDIKLKGASIPFYYTAINGEAVQVLRRYCQLFHKRSKQERPLFFTKDSGRPLTQTWILQIVKKCVKRAGMDPRTVWTHSLRKSFRKIVRQTDLDDDTREMLMGHTIGGSREAYFDRHDLELIKKEYQKCNFTREVPQSEVSKLRAQLEDEQTAREREQGRHDADYREIRERLTRAEEEIIELLKEIKKDQK